MKEQEIVKFSNVLLLVGMLLSGSALAQEQQIVLEESILHGERKATLIYQVSNDELTTGIGFRVHFSSSEVNVLEINNYLELSNVGIQLMPDTEDLDQNPLTDTYINAAWVDLNGEWPAATTMPVKLYSFNFDAIAKRASDLFKISQSSSPVGFEFTSIVTTK